MNRQRDTVYVDQTVASWSVILQYGIVCQRAMHLC